MGDLSRGPAMTGAELGPEHQGEFVEITTVVTKENAAKGLGKLGEQVTVRGMVYHAARTVQFRTGYRVTSVIMRPIGHDTPMRFNLGDANRVRLFTEA
ncbi:hypothetical protein [Actinospica robiniae]|uniref:hypothetical protein n=1 Tax=Actinospica robiniae TaxID=304901 RepID=UPI00041B1684|nr:hypothetical protein [Actinospica robiniae]